MSNPLFPSRCDAPSREKQIKFILESVKIARRALRNGRHPFGCILVSEDDEILFTQGNIDTLNHAETTLCRTAWSNLSPSDLWKCTLYTNFEPCAMCAGSIYWANIGCVVYGCTEEKLLALTGDDTENMTLNLNCRQLFQSGQKDIRVFGPFEEVEKDVRISTNRGTNDRYWLTILLSGKEIRNRSRGLSKNSKSENHRSSNASGWRHG
jgi:tRNA(Arg) A34 adenosine deaminase TadA